MDDDGVQANASVVGTQESKVDSLRNGRRRKRAITALAKKFDLPEDETIVFSDVSLVVTA